MAEPEAPASSPPPPPTGVEDRRIEEEMQQSYLTYAMSVIVSRALPDVRDGLKPSQRRILVAMNDLGLSPRAKYRKCAKIAGDTSGNYHPHGEGVIYPTLVRMAQNFVMRYPLVDGQGNFGSVDGDPPAAMRYTEARLTPLAMEMIEDLDRETVDYVPNYDETRQEPTVLPGRFPNLLCNGSTGIAVGMATSIPPHNLGEVCDALLLTLEKPEAGLEEIMARLPGPDFPTGGVICGSEGIVQGYRTGRGQVTVRAVTTVEERKNRKQIVITEIPYQESKALILERIAALVREGKLDAVADLRDESDREGMRIVVELKKGEDETLTLNRLFEHTQLQSTFSIILIALVGGQPRTLSIREFLQCTIDHRADVVRRRTRFLLKQAEQRAHIVEGLRTALASLDDVIRLIRRSASTEEARAALRETFRLSKIQADAILAMTLAKLTRLERDKLETEHRDLVARIADYRAILASADRVRAIIREEILDLRKRFADARRTRIEGALAAFTPEDLIPDETMAVTVSRHGYIKRLAADSYRAQRRGGVGVTGMDVKEGDFLEHLFIASAHDTLLFFTEKGKAHALKVYEIPEMARAARGRALANLLALSGDDRIASTVAVRDFTRGHVILATERGVVKKTPLAAYAHPKRGGIIAIRLDANDKVMGAAVTAGGGEVMLATRNGFALRCPEDRIREQGRATRGVRGLSLRGDDRVVSLFAAEPDASVLTVCEKGFGKRSPVADYRVTNRGGKGVINVKRSEKTGAVVGVLPARDGDDCLLTTAHGMVLRIPVSGVRATGRNAQGVRLVTLREGDAVVAVARVPREEEDGGAAAEARGDAAP